MKEHKAGFVNIVGNPNVGKSTLMNGLVGDRLSIITSKAQTTRHRILGIINGQDFQIIYSDTPGMIKPAYELQQAMMSFVHSAIEDADILLLVTDVKEILHADDDIVKKVNQSGVPVIIVLNKCDLGKGSQADDKAEYLKTIVEHKALLQVSALEGTNLEALMGHIISMLPVHPPFYPKDALTDKPERFFVSEIIREKIFLNYKKEIPYSCEVVTSEFKEDEEIIHIRVEIHVERKSQKGIIIGHRGESIKKIGMEARKDLEAFFMKKVFLEQFVKVSPDWRKKKTQLDRFGY